MNVLVYIYNYSCIGVDIFILLFFYDTTFLLYIISYIHSYYQNPTNQMLVTISTNNIILYSYKMCF